MGTPGASPPCCEHHTATCEPPSELCCWACPEAAHPEHPAGTRCVLDTATTPPGVDAAAPDLATALYAGDRHKVTAEWGGGGVVLGRSCTCGAYLASDTEVCPEAPYADEDHGVAWSTIADLAGRVERHEVSEYEAAEIITRCFHAADVLPTPDAAARLLAVATARAAADSGRRYDLDEVIAETGVDLVDPDAFGDAGATYLTASSAPTDDDPIDEIVDDLVQLWHDAPPEEIHGMSLEKLLGLRENELTPWARDGVIPERLHRHLRALHRKWCRRAAPTSEDMTVAPGPPIAVEVGSAVQRVAEAYVAESADLPAAVRALVVLWSSRIAAAIDTPAPEEDNHE